MSKLPIHKEENLASLIYFIRGEKVMLDTDLAKLYDVETSDFDHFKPELINHL